MSTNPREAAPRGEEDLARLALERYDLTPESFAFIRAGENTTFRVAAGGRDLLVRVHSGTHTHADQVECEGSLLDHLRSLEFATFQEPIRNRAGEFATRMPRPDGERPVSVLGWIDAPFVDTDTANPERFEQLGELMAKLHTAFDNWRVPASFTRPSWDHRSLAGADGALGFGAIGREILGDEASELIDRVERKLREFESSPIGDSASRRLIHADLHFRNTLCLGDELIPIDFDDCGWSPSSRLYEFAVPLMPNWSKDSYESQRTSLLRGYRRHRNFSSELEQRLPLYIAGRNALAALWMAGRGLDLPDLARRARERTPSLLRTLKDILARE